MGIQRVKQFTADAAVCGEMREVAWELDAGMMMISGVGSYADAQAILKALAVGGVVPSLLESEDLSESRAAEQETQRAARAGEIPLAAPVTRPVKPGEFPRFDLQVHAGSPALESGMHAIKEDKPTPKGGSAPASAPTTSRPEPTAASTAMVSAKSSSSKETSAGAPSASNPDGSTTGSMIGPPSTDDLAVFANMGKFADVVAEVRKRVDPNSYEAILAYCKKLREIGDVCPPVDQIGERLEERLKTHLTGKGVVVPL